METINELFANAAQHFPERPVLLDPPDFSGGKERTTTLTYTMLQRRVQQFASSLQEHGIKKGDRLLIWLASRINWMIAYLAILLMGAVVVPLDVNTKKDFLRRMVQTTEAAYLLR